VLLRDGLLPLIERAHAEVGALAASGKRGDVAEHCARIAQATEHARATAAALVALAALEAGERTLDLTMLDLGETLMSLLARWKSLAPLHDFELALPGEIPLITADAELTEVALNTCLIDALRVTPPGGTIRVSIRPGREAVLVSVRSLPAQVGRLLRARDDTMRDDTPRDDTPRDVTMRDEPARRAALDPPGTEAESEGRTDPARTLERVVARVIVEWHGGRLWEAADPADGGATVCVSWRLVAEPPSPRRWQDLTEVGAASPRGGATASPSAPGARRSAVIWEPDARMARYLRANLDARAVRPLIAETLSDVQRLVELEEPDVVLLDAAAGQQMVAIVARLAQVTEAPTLLLAAE
jgi:hypothetical protein